MKNQMNHYVHYNPRKNFHLGTDIQFDKGQRLKGFNLKPANGQLRASDKIGQNSNGEEA